MPRKKLTDRLWDRVDVRGLDDCWLWTGRTYKIYVAYADHRLPHRVAYELVNGPIPGGHEVHHTCLTPTCCNPRHLVALTHAQHAIFHRKDFCSRGHAMTDDNVYLNPGSGRHCRTCMREWQRERRGRNRAA